MIEIIKRLLGLSSVYMLNKEAEIILGVFTKTQEKLKKLNTSITTEQQIKALEVGKLQHEIAQLKILNEKNKRISEKIDKILE